MSGIEERRLAVFFGVIISLAALFLVVSQSTGVSMLTLAPAYMFTPLIASLVVCYRYGISLAGIGLRVGQPRWLAVSALIGLLSVVLIVLISIAVPSIEFDHGADLTVGVALPSGVVGVLAALALILAVGTTINSFFAFGEELGWRGYLLWELSPLGFWKTSVIIGTVWGIWHTPVIVEGYNFPSFPIVGVAIMTVACIAFTPVYIFLVMRAQSVFAAVFLHGVFNGSAGLILMFTTTESIILSELVANPVGLAGAVAFGLFGVGIAVRGAPPLDRTFANKKSKTDTKGVTDIDSTTGD